MRFLLSFLTLLLLAPPLEAQCYPRATASGGVTITVSDSITGQLVATRATAHTARTTADSLALLTGRTYIVRDQSAIRVSRVGTCATGRVDTVRLRDTLRIVDTVVVETPGPVPPPPPPPTPDPDPPASPTYPNRPANYTRVLTEYGFGDAVPTAMDQPLGSSGWLASWNSAGLTRRGTASDAPVSPTSVLEWAFTRTGTPSGGGVGNIGRSLPNVSQIYIAFWLKHDAQFEFHPISNKLLYLEPGNLILQSRMWADPGRITINNNGGNQEFRANSYTLPLGRWVQFEYLVDAVADRIKLWADGALIIDVPASLAGNYRELKLDSTWGGAGGLKTRDSFRWIDHILVATP